MVANRSRFKFVGFSLWMLPIRYCCVPSVFKLYSVHTCSVGERMSSAARADCWRT